MIPILLMILIMVLSLIPVNDIKERFKHKFTQAKYIKTQLEKYLNIRLSLTTIQNILHIPFFAILAFLWMRFFQKRNIKGKKAIIYTLLIMFFFSLFSELSQFFLSTRDASFVDLLLDLGGSWVGVVIYRIMG